MQFVRLEPNQAPYEGGWVFSSIGDITRKAVFRPEDAIFGRLSLAARNRLKPAVSAAALVAQGVFTALFPSDCRLCGVPLTNISRLQVCQGCLLAIPPISGATCELCGEGLSRQFVEFQSQLCVVCQESRPAFVRAAAYGAYDGELRELIHLLKYEQVAPAADVLGRLLGEAIQKLGMSSDSVLVIPVPLHRSKRRERGFNQSELIARAALRGNAFPRAQLVTNVLERTRHTSSQIGLTRSQRAENIRGAFRVKHLNRVSGQQILLVDDVLTTGTTANECARVLRKAGAAKVWVATVGRTLKQAGSFGAQNFRGDQVMDSGAAIAAKAS